MYFNQARNYYLGRMEPIRLIVIHTAEAPEKRTTAEGIINYFASPNAPRASCHYAVDADSVAQGVKESDTAFAAPGANAAGIQIEHAGYAAQTPEEWNDDYSAAMLENSARLTAELCTRHGIEPIHVTGAALASGTGICGHKDINDVYHRSDHWDPGDSFPWETYINRVRELIANPDAPKARPKPTVEENNMYVIKTITPWNAEVYALVGELTGARALDENEAQAYAKLCGFVSDQPWDYWNLLVRQAWERHNAFVESIGHESAISVEDAVNKLLEALKN